VVVGDATIFLFLHTTCNHWRECYDIVVELIFLPTKKYPFQGQNLFG
jgi:hypothetical protein